MPEQQTVGIPAHKNLLATVLHDGDVTISRRDGGWVLGSVDCERKTVEEWVYEDDEETGSVGALASLLLDAFEAHIATDTKGGLVIRVRP